MSFDHISDKILIKEIQSHDKLKLRISQNRKKAHHVKTAHNNSYVTYEWNGRETTYFIYLFIYFSFVEAINTKRHWVKGKFDHVVQIYVCRLAST